MDSKINEINVFCIGDSNKVSTWSNIPYFLTSTMESKGLKINRIDLSSNKVIESLYYYCFFVFLQKIFKGLYYSYSRSILNRIICKYKINRAINKHSSADINIFLSFSYHSSKAKIPNVLFSDWNYEIHIRKRLHRKPYKIEQEYINYENNIIKNSDVIIPLFPESAEFIRNNIKHNCVLYLNQNVINNFYKFPLSSEAIIKQKEKSFDLLFIGRSHYQVGLNLLITSFLELKKRMPSLKLHIIGIQNLDDHLNDIYYYGFLDKGKKKECELYYNLIINSKLVINPTPNWAGYSSIVECMYFYTPVIITPFDDFVKEFGDEISFGCYYNPEFPLTYYINKIIKSNSYNSYCLNAHKEVENYTWDNYVDLMLEKLNEVLFKT